MIILQFDWCCYGYILVYAQGWVSYTIVQDNCGENFGMCKQDYLYWFIKKGTELNCIYEQNTDSWI